MKNKFKKAFISGAIMAMGLVVGYATSTAFQDLDKIRDNFDYILGISQTHETTIGDLNSTIADLKAEILELEQTQNNSGKQEQIKELEEQVAGLIVERDSLITERDNAINDNAELEGVINDLRVYTDMFVDEEVTE